MQGRSVLVVEGTMEFIVRVETRLLPHAHGLTVDAFAETMLQSLLASDPDADMAPGSREGAYNFWTVVDAEAPDLAAMDGVARIRHVAQSAGGEMSASNVWPSWARAQSVEAYPSAEEDAAELVPA